jgi:D-methionine transport system ATP-binding protein
VGLLPFAAGTMRVVGQDISAAKKNGRQLHNVRRHIGMVFQDPSSSLNPRLPIGESIGEPMYLAGVAKGADLQKRIEALLDQVELPRSYRNRYPHELSGGQKQRVGIARALVHEPEILLCDEATSALDPETTQSILALLLDINRKLGLTVVLITHDMAVIREVCHNVLVLDGGRKVELGEVWRVFGNPQADATRALLRPLQHDLPADLAARLVPDLHGRPGVAVLRLRFTGQGRPDGVSLQALAAMGPGATLLHGGLDRLRGHAQGSLLVSVPAGALQEEAARAALVADQIKVLGYVATDA